MSPAWNPERQSKVAAFRGSLPGSTDEWPEAPRETYEERAAIREFDGSLERKAAERAAEEEVRAEWREAAFARGEGRAKT